MFVDQADIQVLAGDGGRGCVSFRKEKYVPLGGPDGGDGGDGGAVFLESTPGVDTLLDMVGRHHWRAGGGENGMGKKKAGRDGGDLVIRVPPGTLVYDKTSGLLIADLKEAGQRVRVARGGKGGKGNIHFVTPVRQAPDFAEPGQKGQVRELHLELRLIADVGIVGLPNAGKSTLLSRLSAARPKIADYPFTTLMPQLGIAELDAERRLVIADIPGLIEGASEGAGLGLDFLRHIERTRVLVHMIDILPVDQTQPIDAYRQIRAELEAYSPKLAAKPEILVANKMDLAGASEALADLRSELPGKQVYALSAVAGTGLRPLLEALWQAVQRAPASEAFVDEHAYAPAEAEAERPDSEKFEYARGEADEEAWEAVDEGDELIGVGEEEDVAPPRSGPAPRTKHPLRTEEAAAKESGPRREERFINALGEGVPPQKALGKPRGKKSEKAKRTTIEPVGAQRPTAKQRKAAHTQRVKKKVAAQEPAPAESPAPEKAVEDPDLAAEIEAMKADDARKGKYYQRKKTDV
ncbi:MAG TPA: GTPase ObgE [Phycisphaerae bacterium]|nr:GTPase ObgE [Phycisphaerae bacterium]